jgi:FK506-binding protein 1
LGGLPPIFAIFGEGDQKIKSNANENEKKRGKKMSGTVNYPKVIDHLTDVIKELNVPCAEPPAPATAAAAEHGATADLQGVRPIKKPSAPAKVIATPTPGSTSRILANDRDSKIVLTVLKPGYGDKLPQKGETCLVHYVGTLAHNKKKFDSSRDRGKPFEFKIGMGQVLNAWDIGVAQMSVGEISRLTCSPKYAYGEKGVAGVIPSNATLEFEIELLEIK